MNEEKRLDDYEIDMAELEAIAGGKIDTETYAKI